MIDTSKERGSVRPIDLISGGPGSEEPEVLRGFESQEAAIAFDEEYLSHVNEGSNYIRTCKCT